MIVTLPLWFYIILCGLAGVGAFRLIAVTIGSFRR